MTPTETTNPSPSRMVAWWPVLQFVATRLGVEPTHVPEISRRLPLLGTPAWCELADDDPEKLAAVLDGGCRHALRIELAQDALAEGSQQMSAMVDWRAVANEITGRKTFRKKHPWAKRVAS